MFTDISIADSLVTTIVMSANQAQVQHRFYSAKVDNVSKLSSGVWCNLTGDKLTYRSANA
jgi:hypothetical protein